MEEQGGQLLLGGHSVHQRDLWEPLLEEFWNLYRGVDPTHDIFQYSNNILRRTLPYLVHGDEGRGRQKSPLMVISFQGLLSHMGKERLNHSGCLGEDKRGCSETLNQNLANPIKTL